MRNLKKVLAVICVVAMMVTMLAVPALAAGFTYEDEATALNTLGVMNGMNLGNKVTRIEGLTFAIKIAGKDAEAQALTEEEVTTILADVVDADEIPAWGRKYAAYAIKGQFTSGTDASILPKIKFSPMQIISGDSFLYWIMKNMGYDAVGVSNAWETAATDADTITLSQGVIFHGLAELTRDDVAGILYGAVDNGVKKDGTALVTYLISVGLFTQAAAAEVGLADAPAPAALAVTNVVAPNVKQVVITFNKALDGDSAADEANYVIQDKGSVTKTLGADSAVLSSDKMTVTLTLDGVEALTNSTKVKVTVKKDLKDSGGAKLGADYVNSEVTVYDGTVPQVIKAEAIGTKNIKLTFNKPVFDGTDANISALNFAIKNATYSYYVSTATADYANATITLNLGTDMADGNIVVTINNAGSDAADAIRDFAGIRAFKGEVTFAYAKDTTVPTVTVKEATQSKVVLTFNKPVKGTSVTLYHSVKGIANYGVTMTKATASDTWQFDFPEAKKIPTGNVTLFLVNSTVDGEQLIDLYGNKVPDQNLTVTITADTTAPTISSTKVNTNTSFDIKFSENIDANEIKNSNFTLTKASDGKAVSFTTAAVGNDTVRIAPASGTFTDNTTYNVVVKTMKDVAGNIMGETSLSFTVDDNTHPSVAAGNAFTVDGGATDDLIYITFSEAMNAAQMGDKANYLVDPNGGANSFVALDDDDSVTVINEKQVKIKFHDGFTAAPDVKIFPITDLAGKRIGGADVVGYNPASLTAIGAATLEISSAELIAKNKIKIKFTKELANLDASELKIHDATTDTVFAGAAALNVSAVESMVTNSDGVTEAVVIIDQDVRTDAKEKTTGHAIEIDVTGAANTKSVQGTVLSGADAAVTDKLAPSIDKIVFVSGAEIEVYFTEVLNTATVASTGKNGFSVSGGTLATADDFGSTEDILILTSTENGGDFTVDTDVTYTAGNIADPSGNALATKGWTDALTIGAITTTPASPANNTFTISDNFDTTPYALATDIDMDTATAGVQDAITINGVVYTATFNVGTGTVTVTSDGANATADVASGTHVIRITKDGVVKNVTMSYVQTNGAAGANPVFN